ncbi:Mismatch repair protein msh3 [Microbotryomycetes sp. JL221]|nr:Mismatch repair protein msh3 [Microbotryomycetes sp. JL221]
MAPDAVASKQSSISSFFKTPATQTAGSATHLKRPEVLVIDDSDDEETEPTTPPWQPPLKRVKTEHTEANGDTESTQSVSTFFKSTAATTTKSPASGNGASTSRAPRQAERTSTLDKVRRWKFDHLNAAQANTEAGPSSPAVQQRRDRFIAKLLGRDLLQRKHAYLQEDHYLSAVDADASTLDVESDPAEESRARDLTEQQEAEDDQSEVESTAKTKSKSKAKGPPNGRERDSSLSSRLAKYAAKTPQSTSSKTKGKQSVERGPKYTPLEKQVLELKEANPGVVLAIEVGYKMNFYEEDARIASRVLSIAHYPKNNLTQAGIPVERLSIHIKRLLKAGYKVGVVRQKETAALKKISDNRSKPFVRAVDALYTPATYIDEIGFESSEGSMSSTPTLMCVVEGQPSKDGRMPIGLVAVVPSTGEVIYDSFEDSIMRSELETRMLHLQPSELLLPESLSRESKSIVKYLTGQHDAGVPGFSCRFDTFKKQCSQSEAMSEMSDTLARRQRRSMGEERDEEITIDDSNASEDGADEALDSQEAVGGDFKILDLPTLALIALVAMLKHLEAFSLDVMALHASSFHHFSSRSSMCLNGNTLANLEVLVNATDFSQNASLLDILDHCKTPFGKRLLKKWITRPLLSVNAVNERLDAVTEIIENKSSSILTLSKLRDILKGLPDLERGLVRIHLGRATPVELARVLETFQRIANVFQDVAEGDQTQQVKTASSVLKSTLLKKLVNSLPKVKPQVEALVSEINTHRAREGKKVEMFRELPEAVQDCRDCADAVECELMDLLSGIRKMLKKPSLNYISVAQEEFLIEIRITEAKKLVPANWIKINSTKAAYRFRPPEVEEKLKELKQERERLAAAADEAYQGFLKQVSESYDAFRAVVAELATADVLFSFAITATSPGYVRPQITNEAGYINIVEGRHPIVEITSSNPFVPNSVELGRNSKKQMILTGLNMGGKSSFSRSVALIALMAQIGCYVPADSCTTSLFDAILTRMGASDEIARGRSTFMVEMSETSEILKMASPRSLVILDELGRGTSTNDGQAIASAVLEHMVTKNKATTIFVTHYPAIAELARRFPDNVSVNHMSCIESPRASGFVDVTFLYKVIPGLASRSHGLNVAKMADLPDIVLETAMDKSEELERVTKAKLAKRRALVQAA